ncbi:MAG: DNA (cytosine-5-)-methyltransferase [Candidatus Gracilibacteria bacterium]|jgi:DNA (cytosine-5)-methyltransferase 1
MKLLDLFSGIGGFSLAAQWAGFETVQFVEKDLFCQKVLRKHWPHVPIHDDVKTFHYHDNIDLLTGGFPCQGFSVAGKKKGIDDDRYLWPEMFRIIRECKPTWVIAENVTGIIPNIDIMLEDLEREDYETQAFIIPASTIGAPHKRERVWIIANRDSERCNIRIDNRERRHIQDNIEQYFKAIYKEWTQFVPESWKTFDAQEWFTSNTASERQSITGDTEQSMYTKEDREREANNVIDDINKYGAWEKDKPPVSGMDDGLPEGLHRCKSLGNAIVPQVIYPVMKLIYEIERS